MSEHATASTIATAEVEKTEVAAPIVAGPGVGELQALLKQGVPDITKVIDIIDRRPGEHKELMQLVQSLGGTYYQNVLHAMDAIRVDLKRKAIAAGDPSNPQGGYFLASAEEKAARWRTEDGKFQGKGTKDGLDASYQIDDDDALVAKIGKKEGAVAWQRDGETLGEIYGRKSTDGWDAGVRRTFDAGDGATVTPMLRHHQTAQGGQAELAAEYKDKDASTTASGYVGVRESGGGLVAGVDGAHKFSDATSMTGSARYSPDGYSATVSGAHKFSDATSMTGTATVGSGGYSAAVTGAHRFSDTTTGDASLSHARVGDQSTTTASAGLAYQSGGLSASGRLTHTQPSGGEGQTTLSIHERYQSSKVIQSFNFEAGAGARDYAVASGAIDAQLGRNLYAGAWGSVAAEHGKQTTAEIGASITWTPADKIALTAAGVMNQAGQLEGRLQLDVFKSRIDGISDISEHKKKALFSIYAGISSNGGGGMLDKRYGAGSYQYDGQQQNT
ncbi:MAG: hypothetical protein KBG15_19910, partial [Kofleriaceae bacterium]|nr:hypothetical protein [Kofleriaceae bacterium]